MNSIPPNANPNATEPDSHSYWRRHHDVMLPINGVMTMLKTLEAVAAAIALATISFAKAAKGAPHKRKPSDIRDEIG